MYRGKTTIFWLRKSHIFVVTSHAVCFPFRLRFPAAFCGVSASGFGRPPHLGRFHDSEVRYWPDPSRIIWNFDGFWYGPYIWSPYGHIMSYMFCSKYPSWGVSKCKGRKLTCLASEKTWKRAHLFGHPRTMELSLEIREIPALQVDGTSSCTSGSKETKLWSLEIRHDVTRWPNWLMKNLYWKNIPATHSVTHQRLIICCMPLKSCRFY